MATTKRKKQKTSRKKATSKFSTLKVLLYSVFSLFLVILLVLGYQYRDGFLYYLGFKSNKKLELSKDERKLVDIHIYEVLSSHKNHVAGIDVSQYQGKIHWDKLGTIEDNFDIKFVIARATVGKNKVDNRFNENWQQIAKKNIIRGAYHYYRPNENSIAQANLFIKTVNLKKGDLPPILDIEKLPKTQSLDSLKVGLKRWLTAVEKHYNMKPIIYSGESYYNDFLKDDFPEYQFWIANYNFWRKEPENNWLLWQFTEKAKINGIDGMVDVNLLNGDFVRLVSLTKK
ncbi:GH25 family lysozyme [Flavobacterium sp.]|uniref:GH25 family lysozyme n=1 Tax=Flavobacterium sp. TaxID=239 RepID=UPI003528489A